MYINKSDPPKKCIIGYIAISSTDYDHKWLKSGRFAAFCIVAWISGLPDDSITTFPACCNKISNEKAERLGKEEELKIQTEDRLIHRDRKLEKIGGVGGRGVRMSHTLFGRHSNPRRVGFFLSGVK